MKNNFHRKKMLNISELTIRAYQNMLTNFGFIIALTISMFEEKSISYSDIPINYVNEIFNMPLC